MTSKFQNALDQLALRIADRALNRLRRSKQGDDPYHRIFGQFRQMVLDASAPAVLELGSRRVSAVSDGRSRFPGVEDYTGVDIHPGDFVDVVADAHQLSAAFRRSGSTSSIRSRFSST